MNDTSHAGDVVQIVTVICAMITTLATVIGVPLLTYLIAKLNVKQAAAAVKVEQVKATLATASANTDEKLDAVATKVEAVRRATDGIVSQLVAKTEKVAHAEGLIAGKAERAAEELVPDPRPLVNPRQPPPPEPRREL